MKNDLTCGVVRDLLPSYVEGLTSEETNQAVESHLATCPDCTARRDAMAAPEETAAEQRREVDYLKTVKRRSGRRVVIAIVCSIRKDKRSGKSSCGGNCGACGGCGGSCNVKH